MTSEPEPRDVVPGDVLPDGQVVGASPRLVDRRSLLAAGGAALAGAGFAGGRLTAPDSGSKAPSPHKPVPAAPAPARGWAAVRAQFAAPAREVHLNGFVLAVSPLAVRSAVAEYRRRLDVDGVDFLERQIGSVEAGVGQAAAHYLQTERDLVALTDSTTMGLGLVYGGLSLRSGDELLTTEHDFYATHEGMRYAALRAGARVRKVRLYDDPATADAEALVDRLMAAVNEHTRVIGVTWVHSSSGVRYPVEALARRLDRLNAQRAPGQRVLLVVDGVHGLGNQATAPPKLGCDVFVSGCHKWLYGPRGTGIVWARRSAWQRVTPVIPSFAPRDYEAWRVGRPLPPRALRWSSSMTPGGFHTFESRWALAEAFDFHNQLGRRRVAARIDALTTRLRTGLERLANVRLVSPRAAELQSPIVCFEVAGIAPFAAVDRLRRQGVLLSVTPYHRAYVRAGCPLWVDEDGVDRALAAIRALR